MSKRNTKAVSHLRKLKKSHRDFTATLGERLMVFDDELYNLLQGQYFYQQALMALAATDDEVEPWMSGAIVLAQRFRRENDQLVQQLADTRAWVMAQT